MENLLITICARGGSKGIPGKNIKLLNNKPLIQYTIDVAKQIQKIIKGTIIELSTDDSEILKVCSQLGLSSEYIRPAYLATDKSGKVDAIKDLLNYAKDKYNREFNFILDLDVSSPLRTVEEILEAISIFKNNLEALTLFSVNKANKNPYFNMVEENESGFFDISKKRDQLTLSRQTAPKVFELNASFYLYRKKFFEIESKGVITSKSLIFEMNHICFDLDHPNDFEYMDYLLRENKLDLDLL